MPIFKKEKQEKVGLDLQNPENQRIAIQAALEHKVPLINMGNGLFFVDTKHSKEKNLYDFFKQFISLSTNCKQGVIDKDDPKCDYVLIYDLEEKEEK